MSSNFVEIFKEVMQNKKEYSEHKEQMQKSYNKYINKLAEVRVQRKLTLEEIADNTIINSKQHVSRILKGEFYTSNETLESLEKFLLKM